MTTRELDACWPRCSFFPLQSAPFIHSVHGWYTGWVTEYLHAGVVPVQNVALTPFRLHCSLDLAHSHAPFPARQKEETECGEGLCRE